MSAGDWGILGDPAKDATDNAAALQKELDGLTGQYRLLFDQTIKLNKEHEHGASVLDDYRGNTNDAADEAARLAAELKKQQTALDSLLDTLLPAEKATRDFEASLALLDEAFFSGAISAERYDKAIEALTTGVPEAAKAAAQGARQAITQEFDQTTRDIANSLTDALLRGFEDGSGFARNFVESLKNLFSTLILRPIIQPIAQAGAGLITGALGLGASGSASASGLVGQAGSSVLSNILPAGGISGLFGSGLLAAGGGIGGTFGAGLAASGAGFASGGLLGGLGTSLSATGGFLAAGAPLAALGAAVPVLGVALAVAAALGAFSSKKDTSPDLSIGAGVGSNIGPLYGEKNDLFGFVQSQLGQFGVVSQHDAFSDPAAAEQFKAMLGSLAAFEDQLADFVGESVSDSVRVALEQSTRRFKADVPEDFQRIIDAFLGERFDLIFGAIGGNMGRVFGSIAEGGIEAAEATLRLFQGLDSLRDVQTTYTEAVEASERSLYENQRLHSEGLRDLIAGYEGGLEATQNLTAALGEQAVLQLQLLAQIDAAMAQIDATLGGTIERLTLDLMSSDADRYAYLREQAEGLAASLGTLSDPEEIARVVQQIDALSRQGIGLLTDDQLRGGMGEEFIRFLEGVQAAAELQLESTKAQTIADGQAIAAQADAATSQLKAAQTMQGAADTMAGAAATFSGAVRTPIQVNLPRTNGGAEVRPI